MRSRKRVVVDTNALISRLLLPSSVPGQAVRRVVDSSILLVSEATMNELADVLARSKFDRYTSLEDRQQFLRLLGRVAEFVPIVYPVHACRDTKDDKFLEVALNGKADLILTGDTDLLALHPWRDIAIVSPAHLGSDFSGPTATGRPVLMCSYTRPGAPPLHLESSRR